jgi:hypothetical protein
MVLGVSIDPLLCAPRHQPDADGLPASVSLLKIFSFDERSEGKLKFEDKIARHGQSDKVVRYATSQVLDVGQTVAKERHLWSS